MSKELYGFCHKLRVRYHEVDVQKIVFNAHYLSFLDIAWIEYLRNLGLDYGKLFESKEFDTVIAKTTLEYKKPAYYDEILDIYVRVAQLKNRSFIVKFMICKEECDELVLEGEIIHVSYCVETASSSLIPPFIKEKIGIFEKLI